MQKEVKHSDGSKIELTVELSVEEFKEKEQKVLEKLAREADLPGFRKGRTPAEVLRKKIGEQKVLTETAQEAIEDSFREIILKENLEPISRPRINILKLAPGNPFKYKAEFSILPKVKLPAYKKIASEVKREEVSVEEEEVQETLNWLQKARPDLKEVLRPAKKGDWVEISFSSPQLENGRKFEDAFILGKGKLIPGFGDQLLGMSSAEAKEFSLVLPDDFKMGQIAGQEAGFKVTMKSVKETEPREINDDFARDVGEFDSLEELKKSIRQGLLREKEQNEKQRRRAEILNKIVEKTEMEVPEALIQREKENQMAQLKNRVSKQLGVSFEEYLEKINKTQKQLEKTLTKEAKARAERFLILRELSCQEDVEVSKEELEQEMNNFLKNISSVDQAQKEVDLDHLKSYTEDRIKQEKVLGILENF